MPLIAIIPVAVLLICGVAFAVTMGVTSERLEQDRHQKLGT